MPAAQRLTAKRYDHANFEDGYPTLTNVFAAGIRAALNIQDHAIGSVILTNMLAHWMEIFIGSPPKDATVLYQLSGGPDKVDWKYTERRYNGLATRADLLATRFISVLLNEMRQAGMKTFPVGFGYVKKV